MKLYCKQAIIDAFCETRRTRGKLGLIYKHKAARSEKNREICDSIDEARHMYLRRSLSLSRSIIEGKNSRSHSIARASIGNVVIPLRGREKKTLPCAR